MSKGRVLRASLAAFAAVGALGQTAAAAMNVPMAHANVLQRSGIELVDARAQYHCHNMPRRVRCHGKSRLPVNWPPNSNTPSKDGSGEQKS